MAALNFSPTPRRAVVASGASLPLRERLGRLQRELVDLAAEVDRMHARAGRVGRPAVASRPGLLELWKTMEAEITARRKSKSQAARELGISRRTVDRLLAHQKG